MRQRLVLLTGSGEAKFLLPHLSHIGDGHPVIHAETIEQLAAVMGVGTEWTRLLAFCTAEIVPKSILAALPAPSYNIHPGPPTYPGRHPESWGAYDGARQFGATLHEMVPRVDEGRIIDVEWVEMPEGAGQSEFGFRGYRAALQLFVRWAPRLMRDPTPLPPNEMKWSGRKTTHAHLEAMSRIAPDIGAAELERRRRAFAELPGCSLTLDLHGVNFVYEVPPAPDP